MEDCVCWYLDFLNHIFGELNLYTTPALPSVGLYLSNSLLGLTCLSPKAQATVHTESV